VGPAYFVDHHETRTLPQSVSLGLGIGPVAFAAGLLFVSRMDLRQSRYGANHGRSRKAAVPSASSIPSEFLKPQFTGPLLSAQLTSLHSPSRAVRDAMSANTISTAAAIHIVSPAQFDSGTAQTPGSERRAAIAPALGIASAIWGGLFEVEPGSRTGIHHHGQQETIAYVLSGICEVRWGETGEFSARAKPGDFIHVPAFLPHMEINPSKLEPFRWVVVRSTATPVVINLPDDTWP
jgi:uncharacterized RmlC-like cupin family protein